MPPLWPLAFGSLSPEWLIDVLLPIFVTQAVVGVAGLLRLSAIFKRFEGTEFPAFVADVRADLKEIDQDIRGLRQDINAGRVELENLKERVRSIERRQELDDTRAGGPARRPRA